MSDSENKKTDTASAGKQKKSVTRVGDFELRRKLGKGGMGEVFLATQISLDRMVAVKTLSKELSKKEDFVARFLREARSMAKLDHNNIIKVYAVDSYKGLHYAAIEYVDGKTVQDWLDKLEKFPVGDAVHIAMVAAEALDHAHAQQMVHRDIKPDNILLTSKGVPKVADFGLAKVVDEDVSMTQSGTGLGTPLYMAPEQARSAKTVDQRSDIYALGATLYHMLTGKLPFTGESALELIMAKETGKYTSARKLRSDVPDKLDLIVDKMLAKEPEHRYANCEDLIRDLAGLGIHTEALTFMDGAEPTGVARSVTPSTTSLGNTVGTSLMATGIPLDSRADAKKQAKKEKKQKKKTSQTWFVQYEGSDGKPTVEKHTTGRILKMLKSGTLTAKAKAKASASGSYMPLAQFPEFTDAVEEQLSRQAARIRSQDMKNLYKQVERDQTRLKRWRWVSGKFRGVVGIFSLIAWLAFVGIVLWLLFAFGKETFFWLGNKATELMNE